jgi:carbon storage regulator CsrA
MLVLTRKANEEITIGKNVRIVVLGVQGNRVRLGLIAPDNVEIHRVEVDSPNATVKFLNLGKVQVKTQEMFGEIH